LLLNYFLVELICGRKIADFFFVIHVTTVAFQGMEDAIKKNIPFFSNVGSFFLTFPTLKNFTHLHDLKNITL